MFWGTRGNKETYSWWVDRRKIFLLEGFLFSNMEQLPEAPYGQYWYWLMNSFIHYTPYFTSTSLVLHATNLASSQPTPLPYPLKDSSSHLCPHFLCIISASIVPHLKSSELWLHIWISSNMWVKIENKVIAPLLADPIDFQVFFISIQEPFPILFKFIYKLSYNYFHLLNLMEKFKNVFPDQIIS